MQSRDEFLKGIKDALADRVARRCSNPDCQAITSGPQTDPSRATNIGVAAHITAAAEGGPRYDSSLSAEQRSAAENGIWLCQNCAALIDRDTTRFTVELLRGWKSVAEDRARYSMGKAFQPATETESQRKMKKILAMKGAMVTLRWLNAPEHSRLNGRFSSEAEIMVKDCDEDRLFFHVPGSGTNGTLPLEKVMIGYDDQRQRDALECKA